jgi:hypothetical protein
MEVAPGTFLAADFDRAAFDRMWSVLVDWHAAWPEGWIVGVLPAVRPRYPPEIRSLGLPARTLVEHEGLYLLSVG